MKAIVCLPVDFAQNSLGLPALLGEEVDSASVLYHTVSRLTLTDDFEVVLLFTESQRAEKDVALAREMLSGLDCHYMTSAAADVVNREFLRRGRLWSLQAWRGGMGWTSYWDEAGRPAALLEAAERFDADAVGLITPESVYVDPKLTGEILAWHRNHLRSARVTVADVAVGLAPAFFQRDVLQGFAGEGLTFAAVMSYKPTHPQRDLATTDAHFEADIRLRLVPRRFTLHSLRQLELARELSRLGASPRAASALEVVETYRTHPELWPGAVPEKIEIEATSALGAAPFYLKDFLEHRRATEMPIETFTEIVASIGPHRDLLLTLEGLGDPLLHPRAPQLVAAAREAGFLGVHLATFGGRLDEELFSALQEARLDVLSVHVGASSEEGYKRLFGSAGEGGGGEGGFRAWPKRWRRRLPCARPQAFPGRLSLLK